MRKICGFCLVIGSMLLWADLARSGDDQEPARALIEKAIKAAGGVDNLKKHQASTWDEKGIYYGMGEGLPYSGKMAMQYPAQMRMQVFAGEMEIFSIVVDNDKGWMKNPGEVRALTNKEMIDQLSNLKAGWIASLLPLKEKGFTVKVIDGEEVGKKPTSGVKVTRADYPDVTLYFDKETGMLVMSRYPTFSGEQKKMVLAEIQFQNYKLIDGAQTPLRIIIKHDGKLFVETDILNLKAAGKLDASMFAMPK